MSTRRKRSSREGPTDVASAMEEPTAPAPGAAPRMRPMKTFAFDPTLGKSLGNYMTIQVPYEPLESGPVLPQSKLAGPAPRHFGPLAGPRTSSQGLCSRRARGARHIRAPNRGAYIVLVALR